MTLPELHLADWRPTKDTLHLYCQIVGKVRLATTPPRNHWWNAPLYVDVRGLTTRRLHHDDTTFQIDFDFVDHSLLVRTHDGRSRSFELADGVPVADFDAWLHRELSELGIDVEIKEQPFGLPIKTPFPQDREHASWDRDAIERYGRILDWSDCGVRGVQRLVQRQDEPRPSLLAQPRPRRHPLLRTSGAADRRPTPSPRRRTRKSSSPSASGPATTTSPTPPTTPTPAPNRTGYATKRCPSGTGSNSATDRSPSSPTTQSAPHPTRAARCSRSSKPPTRRAPDSPAGTRATSSRSGARARPSCRSFRRPQRTTSAGRARDLTRRRAEGRGFESRRSRCLQCAWPRDRARRASRARSPPPHASHCRSSANGPGRRRSADR